MSAIEQVVGASAQPFIGQELRPDLLGGPQDAGPSASDLGAQMAAGEAGAKRTFDTAPPNVR